jgi:hypothetical protein
MAETVMGGGYKAQIIGIKKDDYEVRLKIRYYVRFLFHPEDAAFETSIKSSSALYHEAKLLQKGDDVWAIPEDKHEVYSCYHYGFFKRWMNRLFN